MRRLLCANFRRLWKSIWFWLCLLASIGWTLFAFWSECYHLTTFGQGLGTGAADGIVFDSIQLQSFIMAVFINMFIGSEYSDKTMRNKIIVGHSKADVYLSNYIVCAAGAIIFYLTHFAIFILVGIPVLGPLEFPQETLICFLYGIFGVAARTAFYTGIAMLIMSKSAGIVVALCVIYFALLSVSWAEGSLAQPEQQVVNVHDPETGAVIKTELMDNPQYIKSPVIRKACEIYIDWTPLGQESTYMSLDYLGLPENVGWFPVYSLVLAGIFTTSGVLVFRKKDLK